MHQYGVLMRLVGDLVHARTGNQVVNRPVVLPEYEEGVNEKVCAARARQNV